MKRKRDTTGRETQAPRHRHFLGLVGALWLTVTTTAVHAEILAQFRTVFGDIEVELYDQDKPATVDNFIQYIQAGRYQDSFIHRCVPGFVFQGGGYSIDRNGSTSSIVDIPIFDTITNEFNRGRILSNTYGTIAMAKRAGDTNSATSQWFFNLADNVSLDAPDTTNLFVVFGKVLRGSNVLEQLDGFVPWDGDPDRTNVIRSFSSPFQSLPLLQPELFDYNLVFVDISLLSVRVSSTSPTETGITWNSVSNMTHHVEFTTQLPPQWNLLVSTNGTGGPMTIVDSDPERIRRFYRVRVSY